MKLEISTLKKFVEESLEGSDLFLVDLTISQGKVIKIDLDSDSKVDIDECADLSRHIEEAFSPEIEEYELEVGSIGITTPLKVKRQFHKYIGKDMEVLTKGGKKLRGILTAVDDDGFTLQCEEKVKPEGAKRPVMQKTDYNFAFGDVKEVKYDLKF